MMRRTGTSPRSDLPSSKSHEGCSELYKWTSAPNVNQTDYFALPNEVGVAVVSLSGAFVGTCPPT